MNQAHIAYLTEVGATKVARDRAQHMWNTIQKLFPEDLKEVFVCDVISDDGVRNYTNLWLFTGSYFAECRNFIESTHFDYTPNNEKLGWVDIQSTSYDLDDNYTDASALRVEARLADGLQMTFTATRNNTIHLRNLIMGPITNMLKLEK